MRGSVSLASRALVTLVVTLTFDVTAAAPVEANTTDIDILMPGNTPTKNDTYSCTAIKLDDADPAIYITGFTPHGKMGIAHHMLLYGCNTPGSQQPIWNCGEMQHDEDSALESGPVCAHGSHLIYGWAMDAPATKLPPGVGFRVGGDTGIDYLVVQVHYKDVSSFTAAGGEPDHSGLTITTTTTPQPKLAGTFILGTGGRIPPHSTTYMEAGCEYTDVDIHPFAFRTHTHKLGKVVSGYRVRDGNWTEIGRKSPQDPQMFYTVTTPDLTIKAGDTLAARCTMQNNGDNEVDIGPTAADEMCNFYMMYYVDGDELPRAGDCFTMGPPNWSWSNMKSVQGSSFPTNASAPPGEAPLAESSNQVWSYSSQGGNMSPEQQAAVQQYFKDMEARWRAQHDRMQQHLQDTFGDSFTNFFSNFDHHDDDHDHTDFFNRGFRYNADDDGDYPANYPMGDLEDGYISPYK